MPSSSSPGLQIGTHPGDRSRPRVAAVAKVEYEPGVADDFPAESGWSYVTLAKKFFYFSEQMHGSVLILVCDSAANYFPTHFLLV